LVQRTFGLKAKDGVEIFELNLGEHDEDSHQQQQPIPPTFNSGREVWKEFKRILDEDAAPLLSDEEIQLILQVAPKVFLANNSLVSTVQRSRSFGKAAVDCTRRIGVALAVVVAVIAIIVHNAKRR
jgi:hypothetical protein